MIRLAKLRQRLERGDSHRCIIGMNGLHYSGKATRIAQITKQGHQ